jgi:glycosyltransferase involved in cell wall biosynthesis
MDRSPADVAAVVCTLNSISGIERCLISLRSAGVAQLIVVDANSTDGTREIAERLADSVLTDPGTGLGNARNVGIAATTVPLVLNMGSDNVMPAGQLQIMIDDLDDREVQGVSARTIIEGDDYVSKGLNAWRTGRFVPGPAAVIGTPTLFDGDLLRAHPYDATRKFSDDSELCERWARDLDATFAISSAYVEEIGKTSWDEVVVRCRMYGISDEEVFRIGRSQGWSTSRQAKSLLHPARVDLVEPITRLSPVQAVTSAPFLMAFSAMRYGFWLQSAVMKLRSSGST